MLKNEKTHASVFKQRCENTVIEFTGVLPGYVESVMFLEPHLSMQS